jgi:hypothetical protein
MSLDIPGLDLSDPDTIDLGKDHVIRLMYSDETEQEVTSVILLHRNQEDPEQICQGFAEIGPGEWKIAELHPLTVHPSFVCSECKDHGIIRAGQWIDATFDTRPQLPIKWLLMAIASFCVSEEEARYMYRYPIPEYQYYTPHDLAVSQRWNALFQWLNEQESLRTQESADTVTA